MLNTPEMLCKCLKSTVLEVMKFISIFILSLKAIKDKRITRKIGVELILFYQQWKVIFGTWMDLARRNHPYSHFSDLMENICDLKSMD